jgi:hypothetical protein
MSINTLRRVARATSLAAVIVVAFGVLESTGWPLSAAVGNAMLNLASVQSETKKLRRRVTGAIMASSTIVQNARDSAYWLRSPVIVIGWRR